jgi:hypothetical protein
VLPRELMWSFIMTSIEFFKEVQSRRGRDRRGGGKFLRGESENFEENTR